MSKYRGLALSPERSRRIEGFTLIELLVVISIISVLSVIGVSSYRGVQERARDTTRKEDLKAIAQALELYEQTHSNYVLSASSECNTTNSDSLYNNSEIISYMDNGYIPKDPSTNEMYCYYNENSGGSYRLFAKLENNSDPEIIGSPDWFDYSVTSPDIQLLAAAGTPPSPTLPPTGIATQTPPPGATATPTVPPGGPTPTPSNFICNVPASTQFPSPTPGPAAVVVPVSPIPQGGSNCDMSDPKLPAGATFYALGVTCGGLPQRIAVIAERNSSGTRGGVLFTTGSSGSSIYSTESTAVVTTANNGFRTFEVCWYGGWPVGNAGFKNSACAYAGVARWIYNNKIQPQADVMCGTGNSGGSMQNGYGLAVHGLEDILDLAVLSGGPPTSRADILCFGTIPPVENSTDGSAGPTDGGRGLTDGAEGWPGNCVDPTNKPPTQVICTQAQNTSIASPTEYRDYNYPNTKVNFIEGGNDPLRFNGIRYHDLITSNKTWSVLVGAPHGLHRTGQGATAISNSIDTDCHNW